MAIGSIQDPRKRPRDPDLAGMGGDLFFHAPDLARFSLQIDHSYIEPGLSEGLLGIRLPSGPTSSKINAKIHDAIAQGS
eukprot:1093627-Pyramimonas_sp.AAC.1